MSPSHPLLLIGATKTWYPIGILQPQALLPFKKAIASDVLLTFGLRLPLGLAYAGPARGIESEVCLYHTRMGVLLPKSTQRVDLLSLRNNLLSGRICPHLPGSGTHHTPQHRMLLLHYWTLQAGHPHSPSRVLCQKIALFRLLHKALLRSNSTRTDLKCYSKKNKDCMKAHTTSQHRIPCGHLLHQA